MSEIVKDVEYKQKENISNDEKKITKCYLSKYSIWNDSGFYIFEQRVKHQDAIYLYFYVHDLDFNTIFKNLSSMVNYYCLFCSIVNKRCYLLVYI